MDAVEILKRDHQQVQELFRRYEATVGTDYSTRRSIVDECCKGLLVHAIVEEEIFYPAVQERGGDQERAIIERSVEEHRSVEELIFQARDLSAEDEQFDACVRDIIDGVQGHITDEETDTFPRAQGILGPQLEQLGEQITSRKEELQEVDVFAERESVRRAQVPGG